jgi:hypothetical protein
MSNGQCTIHCSSTYLSSCPTVSAQFTAFLHTYPYVQRSVHNSLLFYILIVMSNGQCTIHCSSPYLSLCPTVSAQFTALLHTYPYVQRSVHNMVGFCYKCHYICFSQFKTNMLAQNHSTIRAGTRFTNLENFVKFLLEITTVVSSANNIGSAREFIRNERSFV